MQMSLFGVVIIQIQLPQQGHLMLWQVGLGLRILFQEHPTELGFWYLPNISTVLSS
jgi:hypothetical protein